MGFFNNSNQSHQNTRSDSTTTIITAGTKITGNINLSCNLYIDGYFEGNINSEQEINIGKNGKIKGEINTKKSAELNKLMESLGKLQNHA